MSWHYLHVFSTFCAAGPQVRAVSLMRGMGPAIRHSVVALDGRTGAAALAADVQLEIVDRPAAPGGVRGMRSLLRSSRPDLLLSYNWGAIEAPAAAASLRFGRVVHHEDGFNADEAGRLKLRRNWTRRLVLRNTEVIVPSRNLETIAWERWHLERLHFIPNGIDASRFDRDPDAGQSFRESLGIGAEDIVIGAVGHLRPVKNYRRLVRAVAKLGSPDVHLLIAGEGAEREALQAAAADHGVSLHLPGHLEDLRAVYSAFDVFAISSDSEQQPVALLEAMAAGLPVCATDVGDVGLTLPKTQREWVVGLDDDALAAGLRQLAGDAGLRGRLGGGNRSHVETNYTVQAMLAAYAGIYAAASRR